MLSIANMSNSLWFSYFISELNDEFLLDLSRVKIRQTNDRYRDRTPIVMCGGTAPSPHVCLAFEGPIHCPLCGKRFNDHVYDLIKHMATASLCNVNSVNLGNFGNVDYEPVIYDGRNDRSVWYCCYCCWC